MCSLTCVTWWKSFIHSFIRGEIQNEWKTLKYFVKIQFNDAAGADGLMNPWQNKGNRFWIESPSILFIFSFTICSMVGWVVYFPPRSCSCRRSEPTESILYLAPSHFALFRRSLNIVRIMSALFCKELDLISIRKEYAQQGDLIVITLPGNWVFSR